MKTSEISASASSSRSDMLRDVREKIEKGWTQGTLAVDANGISVPPRSHKATCWCLAGAAIASADPELGWEDIRMRVTGLLAFEDPSNLMAWNDTKGRTQADVLRRIDQALERAGGGDPSSSTGAA